MELKFLECIVLQLVHWQEVDFHYQRTKMKFCLFLMKKRRKKTQNREGKCFYFHRSNINCIVIAQTAEIVIQYPTIAMRPSICNQNWAQRNQWQKEMHFNNWNVTQTNWSLWMFDPPFFSSDSHTILEEKMKTSWISLSIRLFILSGIDFIISTVQHIWARKLLSYQSPFDRRLL